MSSPIPDVLNQQPAPPPVVQQTATTSRGAAQMAPQYVILAAVIAGWLFSLVEYYVNHVAIAQPIADGGWAALLIAFRADFGTNTTVTTNQAG